MTIRQDSEQGSEVPPALNEAATGKAILEYAEKMLEAVNEAGQTVGALTISFIVLTTFLHITQSTVLVEAEHLVKESTSMSLPLINVKVSTRAFFGFVPILFIAFHFYLLLQFHLLGRKVRHLDELVASLPDNEKRYIRDRIINSVFIHLLVKSHPLSRTMEILVCIFLLFYPSYTLSYTTLFFWPYGDFDFTTFHKIITIIDLGIIIALWPKIVSEQSTWCWWWQRLQRAWARIEALCEWIFRQRSEPPTERVLSSPISEKPGIGALWIVAIVVISLFVISVPGFPIILSEKVLVSNNNKLAPEIVNILREGSGHERERAMDKVLLTFTKVA